MTLILFNEPLGKSFPLFQLKKIYLSSPLYNINRANEIGFVKLVGWEQLVTPGIPRRQVHKGNQRRERIASLCDDRWDRMLRVIICFLQKAASKSQHTIYIDPRHFEFGHFNNKKNNITEGVPVA